MKDLVARLGALDADAGAAVRVISYFDTLVEAKAGLSAVVRAAAVLAGCPARLVDEARHLVVRVDAEGVARPATGGPDPEWPTVELARDGARLWLERSGPPGNVDAMILDRAATAVTTVLDRTRGGPARSAADDGLVEVVLDAQTAETERRQAARRLGLADTARFRAAAFADGTAQLLVASAAPPAAGRVGVGPAVAPIELPASVTAARVALRFTAAGTDADPGPRVVYADSLGGLAVLARAIGPGTPPEPDVLAVSSAASAHPWLLTTLSAVAESVSLRTAATELRVHHSSLQDRVAIAERLLGWNIREPGGRLRLQLALAMRRLHANPS